MLNRHLGKPRDSSHHPCCRQYTGAGPHPESRVLPCTLNLARRLPPSSLYCCQRSSSISSTAARSLRIATSPSGRCLRSPRPPSALFALPSKAAPGASRAAPRPRLRRKDRLARRRGCGNSRLRFDDSALSRGLVALSLISDFIEGVSIGLVLVRLLGKNLPYAFPYPFGAILFPKSWRLPIRTLSAGAALPVRSMCRH